MDPLDVVREFGVAGGLTMAGLMLALSVRQALPDIMSRYRLGTQRLTEKDAQQAQEITRKVNGALHHISVAEIERRLAGSVWFRENVIDPRISHRIRPLEVELEAHVAEDRVMHERVKGLEVKVDAFEHTAREIRSDLRVATERISEEAKEIRREMNEGNQQIMQAVYTLADRREKART